MVRAVTFMPSITNIRLRAAAAADLLHPEQYDVVITCGPEVMMRKVAAMCAEKDVTCYCSLEHRMACGIGACLGCSIRTTEGMKRVCKDGPVFRADEIFSV